MKQLILHLNNFRLYEKQITSLYKKSDGGSAFATFYFTKGVAIIHTYTDIEMGINFSFEFEESDSQELILDTFPTFEIGKLVELAKLHPDVNLHWAPNGSPVFYVEDEVFQIDSSTDKGEAYYEGIENLELNNDPIVLPSDTIKALKKIIPFMGTDPSRQGVGYIGHTFVVSEGNHAIALLESPLEIEGEIDFPAIVVNIMTSLSPEAEMLGNRHLLYRVDEGKWLYTVDEAMTMYLLYTTSPDALKVTNINDERIRKSFDHKEEIILQRKELKDVLSFLESYLYNVKNKKVILQIEQEKVYLIAEDSKSLAKRFLPVVSVDPSLVGLTTDIFMIHLSPALNVMNECEKVVLCLDPTQEAPAYHLKGITEDGNIAPEHYAFIQAIRDN